MNVVLFVYYHLMNVCEVYTDIVNVLYLVRNFMFPRVSTQRNNITASKNYIKSGGGNMRVKCF